MLLSENDARKLIAALQAALVALPEALESVQKAKADKAESRCVTP